MYTGDTEGVLSDIGYPPYPKNIQCYWRVPKEALIAIEFGIFVLLGLSGELRTYRCSTHLMLVNVSST